MAQERVFEYRGYNFDRAYFEEMPCPINTSSISDEKLEEMAKEIFIEMANVFRFYNFDSYREKYGRGKSREDYLEFLLTNVRYNEEEPFFDDLVTFDDCSLEIEETTILRYGATYYEDE